MYTGRPCVNGNVRGRGASRSAGGGKRGKKSLNIQPYETGPWPRAKRSCAISPGLSIRVVCSVAAADFAATFAVVDTYNDRSFQQQQQQQYARLVDMNSEYTGWSFCRWQWRRRTDASVSFCSSIVVYSQSRQCRLLETRVDLWPSVVNCLK